MVARKCQTYLQNEARSPKHERDLQNETASPNSKRDLQIHNYGFSEVCVYEFGDRVLDWEMPFRFGDRVSFWR